MVLKYDPYSENALLLPHFPLSVLCSQSTLHRWEVEFLTLRVKTDSTGGLCGIFEWPS